MTQGKGRCRILYVIDDMGVGGAQKQVAETVNRLNGGEFSCDIACVTRGGATLEKVRGAGEVYVLGADRIYDHVGAAAALRLGGIIRSGRYAIVEAYLPMAHLFGAMAVVGLRRTALVAARRQSAWLDPGWMKAAGGFLDRVTRLSIANSRAVKRSLVERYGLSPERIAVIPNIIETGRPQVSRAEARERLAVSPGAFACAAAGSFVRVKDYPTIIRAFAEFSRRGGKGVLLLAGEGGQRRGAAAFASRLGLDGEVRFLGSVPDIRMVLAAADVFVHASHSEGMSNAILEAMAAGQPVVASDIPANREAMGDGCGVFFAPGDWEGCLRGIEHFADDTAAAARAGRAAQERIRLLYNCDAIIGQRERIYGRLAGATNGKGRE